MGMSRDIHQTLRVTPAMEAGHGLRLKRRRNSRSARMSYILRMILPAGIRP